MKTKFTLHFERAEFAAAIVGCGLALSEPGAAQAPLFESSEPVELRLEAPFRRMFSEEEGRFPALMILSDSPDDSIRLRVSPRGKSRLTQGICEYPGLMLFFSGDLEGTPFDGQDVLPAVSHCRDRDSYEQNMLLEYLAYRMYNVVADLSLKVRLARIEYYDSGREETISLRYGFFVEHWDDLAERNGWIRLNVPLVPPDEYEPESRTVLEVFQYLIGNTDWSYARSAPSENSCCHNVVPIGKPAGPVFPLPYDFDYSGLVDAPYADPDRSLPIRTVRERLFRGVCGSKAVLNAVLGRFEVRRSEIDALFEDADYLDDDTRRRSLRYVESFYRTIADDGEVERKILSKCRRPGL